MKYVLLFLALATVGQAQVARSTATAYEPVASTAFPITTAPITNDFTYTSATQIYRFVSSVDANVTFGTSPTATTSSTLLPAYTVEVWPIRDNARVSVRSIATPGVFYIDRMSK